MKKRIKAIIIFGHIMLFVGLFGCQKEKNMDDNHLNEHVDSQKNKKEIILWHSFDGYQLKDATQLAIKKFNESHSNVYVKEEFVSNIEANLINAVNGGSPPDVIFIDRFMVSNLVVKEKVFLDLTDMARRRNIKESMFYDFAWQEATVNGTLYALPFDTDARVLYYNKQLFRDAGLDPDKPPKTIEELDEYARQLTKKNQGQYTTLGFVPWIGQGWLYTWGWAFGGQFIDNRTDELSLYNEEIIKALEWEKKYANQYNFEEIMHFLADKDKGLDPFADGRVAMIVGGSWHKAEYKKNYPDLEFGITHIPVVEGEDYTTWSGGYALAIPKGSMNAEYAFDFIKYMCMGEGAKIHQNNTYHFLCYKELNQQSELINQDEEYKFMVELLPYSNCRPPISNGPELWNQLIDGVEKVLHNEVLPGDLLKDISLELKEIEE